ncbi:hypothetical protein DSLASN_09280 [Desulfoluna limicola]|uniref:Uncharacterized protein n=1 Tax=Desulfoluna limicola TaxID=2810562 RepID=A0ABN6F143_9BACT|nr:hypothetical protein DSLASN_09280 [Desulfoluna limicola]
MGEMVTVERGSRPVIGWACLRAAQGVKKAPASLPGAKRLPTYDATDLAKGFLKSDPPEA